MIKAKIFNTLFSLLIAILIGLMTACSSAVVSTSTPRPMFSMSVQKIAFFSDSIYVVNDDGSDLYRLTELSGVDKPAWSPNGDRVTFSNSHIYFTNSEGTGLVHLTQPQISSLPIDRPVWSPDGKQIAFAIYGGDGNGDVYLIDVEKVLRNQGSDSFRKISDEHVDAQGLGWSPDGRYLGFYYRPEVHESYRIAVLDVKTGEATILVYSASSPAWSPNGKQMAFVCGQEFKGDICLINDVAEAIREFKPIYPNLTQNDADDESPVWSPDGQQILYVYYDYSKRDKNYEIYVMNADGSNQRNLTNNPFVDNSPSWSPDGKQIAFVSNRDGNQEIYVMDADGSNLLRLTNNDVDDWGPVWQPQP